MNREFTLEYLKSILEFDELHCVTHWEYTVKMEDGSYRIFYNHEVIPA